jgi:hypothetical protein
MVMGIAGASSEWWCIDANERTALCDWKESFNYSALLIER